MPGIRSLDPCAHHHARALAREIRPEPAILGHYHSTVDGLYGRGTRGAIVDDQTAKNLLLTTEPVPELGHHLRNGLKVTLAPPPADSPAPKPNLSPASPPSKAPPPSTPPSKHAGSKMNKKIALRQTSPQAPRLLAFARGEALALQGTINDFAEKKTQNYRPFVCKVDPKPIIAAEQPKALTTLETIHEGLPTPCREF